MRGHGFLGHEVAGNETAGYGSAGHDIDTCSEAANARGQTKELH